MAADEKLARSVLYGLVGTKGAARLLRLRQALASTMGPMVGEVDLHLDHDPPLAARMKRTVWKDGKQITVYSPGANSPDHLFYRERHAHLIKTNIRGEHGQFPDRVLIKRERKRLKQKSGKLKTRPRAKIKSRGFDKTRTRRFNGTIKERQTRREQ
jgi:hypothetical protein